MAHQLRYPWTAVSSGRWERPLWGLEKLLVALARPNPQLCGGREGHTLCGTITLSPSSSENRPLHSSSIRDAWARLRWEQPSIACSVDAERNVLIYDIPTAQHRPLAQNQHSDLRNSQPIDDWVADSFVVLADASSVREIYSNLEPLNGRSKLYWLPQSHQLMLRCPHFIVDGRGLLQTLDLLLSLLTQESPIEGLIWGDETARLSPSVIDLLGPDAQTSQASPDQQDVDDYIARFLQGVIAPIGPPTLDGPLSQPDYNEIVISKAETSTIGEGIKERGWNWGGAINAALLVSELEASSSAQKDKIDSDIGEYWFGALADVRYRVPDASDAQHLVVNNAFVNWPSVMPLQHPATQTDFQYAGDWFSEFYRSLRGDARMSHFPPTVALQDRLYDQITLAFNGSETPTKSVFNKAYCSYLGVVDLYIQYQYGHLKVDHFHLAEEVTWGQTAFFAWSWRGQLNIGHSFNRGTFEADSLVQVDERVKRLLLSTASKS